MKGAQVTVRDKQTGRPIKVTPARARVLLANGSHVPVPESHVEHATASPRSGVELRDEHEAG
jgi:hypothetical protein